MKVRRARPEDRTFVVEMARLASTLEGRPLPAADDPAVLALLPRETDLTLLATDDARPVGAVWWHLHEPALLRDDADEPLPEMAMAVVEARRREGIGTALVESLAQEAARRYEALTLNVHLRNPAVELYMRTGFSVAGAGRGPFGVAMSRSLRSGA